jgi:hypothetical protein
VQPQLNQVVRVVGVAGAGGVAVRLRSSAASSGRSETQQGAPLPLPPPARGEGLIGIVEETPSSLAGAGRGGPDGQPKAREAPKSPGISEELALA